MKARSRRYPFNPPRRFWRWILLCESQQHAAIFFNRPRKAECPECGLAAERIGPLDVITRRVR